MFLRVSFLVLSALMLALLYTRVIKESDQLANPLVILVCTYEHHSLSENENIFFFL